MHSLRRLIQNYEALSDEARAFLLKQSEDLILVPRFQRRSPLHLVQARPTLNRFLETLRPPMVKALAMPKPRRARKP